MMDARRTPLPPPGFGSPEPAPEEPLSAADEAALREAEESLDRGEFVSHEEMEAWFKAAIARHHARAAQAD